MYEFNMKANYFYPTLLNLCLMLCLPTVLFAQQKLSKDEAKKLKQELNALSKSLEKWKAQKTEAEELKVTENIRNATLLDLKSRANKQDSESRLKDNEILAQKAELDKLSPSLQSPQTTTQNRASYRVQVGAYFNSALAQALQAQQSFEIETMDNGMKRYLVGKFTSFNEANKFTEKLRQTGAQAFVVGYLDGKRLTNLKEMPDEFKQK